MHKSKLSCGRCWTRAFSTVSISAIFLATGTLHIIDPSHIESLGLPRLAAYLIGASEIAAVAGLWTLAESAWIETLLMMVTAAAAGLYIRTGQYSLLPLPLLPMALLGVLKWVNRPQLACSCGLRHHEAGSS